MKSIFTSPSFLVFFSCLIFVNASEKRVEFNLDDLRAKVEIKRKGLLLEKVEKMYFGEVLLEEVRNCIQKDPTDSIITAYLVLHLRLAELESLEDFLVVDAQVLTAFIVKCKNAQEDQLNNLLLSFPALFDHCSILFMASNLKTYIKPLRVICYLRPKAFFAALPEIKEKISNVSHFMTLMWFCLRSFRLEETLYELKTDRIKYLRILAAEFLYCTKEVSFVVKDQVNVLFDETKVILVELSIEIGCLNFLKFYIATGFFDPKHKFSCGVVRGNALMFVNRNVQILSELLKAGVELESCVLIMHSRRLAVISMFTYLYLQGDVEMNTFLMSRQYPEQVYFFVAEDSVIYNLPELTDFVLKRCPDAEDVIAHLRAEQHLAAMKCIAEEDMSYEIEEVEVNIISTSINTENETV